MLLVSAFSTETAETWCRVALGATVDLDDDDGLSFVCRPVPAHNESARRTGRNAPAQPNYADAVGGRTMPDAPAYPLPALTGYILPTPCERVVILWAAAIAYPLETRGPPLAERAFARPPPRAPPIL